MGTGRVSLSDTATALVTPETPRAPGTPGTVRGGECQPGRDRVLAIRCHLSHARLATLKLEYVCSAENALTAREDARPPRVMAYIRQEPEGISQTAKDLVVDRSVPDFGHWS